MKKTLAIVGLVIVVAVIAVVAQRTPAPPRGELPSLGLQETAIYFRDAYGRCLRLQTRIRVADHPVTTVTTPEHIGHLDIFLAADTQCVKRERSGR